MISLVTNIRVYLDSKKLYVVNKFSFLIRQIKFHSGFQHKTHSVSYRISLRTNFLFYQTIRYFKNYIIFFFNLNFLFLIIIVNFGTGTYGRIRKHADAGDRVRCNILGVNDAAISFGTRDRWSGPRGGRRRRRTKQNGRRWRCSVRPKRRRGQGSGLGIDIRRYCQIDGQPDRRDQ